MWQGYVMRFVVFGMLSAVVLNMMPKEVYKKYMKFVMGFMLMMILLEPLTGLTGGNHFSDLFDRLFADVCAVEQLPGFSETEDAYQALLYGFYEEQVTKSGEEPWVTTEDADILWQAGQGTSQTENERGDR